MTQGDDLAARLLAVVQQSQATAAAREDVTADRLAAAAAEVDAAARRVAAAGDAAAGALEGSAATVARRAHELERAAEALPEEVTVSLQGVLDGVKAEADAIGRRVEAAVDAALVRLDDALAAAAERVEALEARLAEVGASVSGDVQLTAQGLTTVGKSVLDQLITVLDERDARDAKLEERLTARVDRLTKKTADRVAEIAGLLDAQVARLDERDLAERATQAELLHDLVQQLLNQPRGVLKDLRRG